MAEGEYERRVVAFLDILGFSRLVEHADDPEWRRAIEGVVSVMRQTLAPNPTMADLRFTQFSDCIVISARAEPMWGLYGVFSGAIMLCDNMLHRQVLLRGGIAVGNLVHTDDVLFGPGLLAAYAKDTPGNPPRISLHDTAIEEVKAHDTVWGIDSYVRTDPYDLTPILHTLEKYERYTATPSPGAEALEEPAKRLASAIAGQCYKAAHPPSVRAKWLWLERYWNDSVSKKNLLTSTFPYRP